MAYFARFIITFAIWALIASSGIVVLGIFNLIQLGQAAYIILPALVLGQISAILVGNWGAIARLNKFGIWTSMTSERGPGPIALFGYFRAYATLLSLWRWVIASLALLGLSVGWTSLCLITSTTRPIALPIPFLCAIGSLFFLAQALMSIGALRDRGLIGEQEDPNS